MDPFSKQTSPKVGNYEDSLRRTRCLFSTARRKPNGASLLGEGLEAIVTMRAAGPSKVQGMLLVLGTFLTATMGLARVQIQWVAMPISGSPLPLPFAGRQCLIGASSSTRVRALVSLKVHIPGILPRASRRATLSHNFFFFAFLLHLSSSSSKSLLLTTSRSICHSPSLATSVEARGWLFYLSPTTYTRSADRLP